MSEIITDDYIALIAAVKARVRAAQYEALRAVNKKLVGLYWDLGRLISNRQQEASWGKSVVDQLSRDLQAEFPGIGGFSASNIWRMRLFFQTYAGREILAPLVRDWNSAANGCRKYRMLHGYLNLPPLVAETVAGGDGRPAADTGAGRSAAGRVVVSYPG